MKMHKLLIVGLIVVLATVALSLGLTRPASAGHTYCESNASGGRIAHGTSVKFTL